MENRICFLGRLGGAGRLARIVRITRRCAIGKIRLAEKNSGALLKRNAPLFSSQGKKNKLLQSDRHHIRRQHVAVAVIDFDDEGEIAARQIGMQLQVELI